MQQKHTTYDVCRCQFGIYTGVFLCHYDVTIIFWICTEFLDVCQYTYTYIICVCICSIGFDWYLDEYTLFLHMTSSGVYTLYYLYTFVCGRSVCCPLEVVSERLQHRQHHIMHCCVCIPCWQVRQILVHWRDIHTHTHSPTFAHPKSHARTLTHTRAHTTHTHTHTRAHTPSLTHTHTNDRTPTHTYSHTQTNTNTDIQKHPYTHTYTII